MQLSPYGSGVLITVAKIFTPVKSPSNPRWVKLGPPLTKRGEGSASYGLEGFSP
jgi:hypothetical protein